MQNTTIFNKRRCIDCVRETKIYDHKNIHKLTPTLKGESISRRWQTGTCIRHQKMRAKAIKKARHLGLIPFVSTHKLTA